MNELIANKSSQFLRHGKKYKQYNKTTPVPPALTTIPQANALPYRRDSRMYEPIPTAKESH